MKRDIGDTSKKASRLWQYLAVFLVALSLRILSGHALFFDTIDAGHRNFEIFDSTYHMRRVRMTIEDYPTVPFLDTYHYYPSSPAIPWPPGYTLLLATIAKPFDATLASPLIVETVVGMVPCIFDSLTVVLYLFLISRYFSFQTALVGALFLATSFINVRFSEIGYIDHHYFINFLVAVFSILIWRFTEKPSWQRSITLGLVLGFGTFFNVSVIQYVLLALLVLVLAQLLDKNNRASPGQMTAIFGAALLSSLLSAMSTPIGRSLHISYAQTSLFHALTIAGIALFWCSMFIWQAEVRWIRGYRIPLSAFILVTLGSILLLSSGDIAEGARFLILGNRLNGTQGEEASILSYYPFGLRVFSLGVILLPVGLYTIAKRFRNHVTFSLLVILFFFHGFVSGISHLLYVQYLYPWYSILMALGLQTIILHSRAYLRNWSMIVYVPFAIQIGHTTWTAVIQKPKPEIEARKAIKETIEALSWLRTHSPSTSHWQKGDGLPEYSILAHRDYGHQIARIARRPAITSPFSTPEFLSHMQDYARFTFSRHEAEVVAIMDKYRGRYLVVDGRENGTVEFLLHLLQDEHDFDVYAPRAQPSALAFLLRNNLLFFDGELRLKNTKPIEHFRLVYEVPSKNTINFNSSRGLLSRTYNSMKIFELVKGARVSAHGFISGDNVIFQLPLRTNTGREFTYTNSVVADENGVVNVILPYSTEIAKGSSLVPLLGYYSISSTSSEPKRLAITDTQIINGSELLVNP